MTWTLAFWIYLGGILVFAAPIHIRSREVVTRGPRAVVTVLAVLLWPLTVPLRVLVKVIQ